MVACGSLAHLARSEISACCPRFVALLKATFFRCRVERNLVGVRWLLWTQTNFFSKLTYYLLNSRTTLGDRVMNSERISLHLIAFRRHHCDFPPKHSMHLRHRTRKVLAVVILSFMPLIENKRSAARTAIACCDCTAEVARPESSVQLVQDVL